MGADCALYGQLRRAENTLSADSDTGTVKPYAVLIVPETLVDAVSQETVIEYVEKPKQLYFDYRLAKLHPVSMQYSRG